MAQRVSVSMQAGVSGGLQITIERWTTRAERTMLLNVLAKGGQDTTITEETRKN